MYRMFMLFVVKVKLNKCGTAKKNNLGLGSTKLKNNRARCFLCC